MPDWVKSPEGLMSLDRVHRRLDDARRDGDHANATLGVLVAALRLPFGRDWPPPLLCADLWMCPSPRDRRRHWRLLGIFASPQDAEDASDAGA